MKALKYFSILLFALFLAGCNDEFMERYPTTSISDKVFFESVNDLRLYSNTFYEFIQPWDYQIFPHQDYVSDNNVTYMDNHERNHLLRGGITASNVSGWNNWNRWGELRRINFMLDHVHRVEGDRATIAHYTAIARLFRAMWYYDMVKRYNNVPWYSKPLTDADEALLYKTQDSRTLVVDSIIADLNYATTHITPDMGDRTLISKWYALAMKARICLHEGTFRKYHKELNLQGGANAFLEQAAQACEEIMKSGLFEIDHTGGKDKAYRDLFVSFDLSKSKEMILYKNYDYNAGINHTLYGLSFMSLSRSLMESYEYLTDEGKAIPFGTVKDYEKKGYMEVFENRDPRFRQTFQYPGFKTEGQITASRPNLKTGGYTQIKFVSESADPTDKNPQCTDLPVFRYAEVLLIYAEAKAELQRFTQDDMDKTLNAIRDRVAMPPIIIGNIINDPNLKKQYPNISDPVLREIRRERRIELACENFRWDDLMRWAAADLIKEVQQGVYIKEMGAMDTDGDGKVDVALFKDESSNTLTEEEKANCSVYYLINSDGTPNVFKLTEENSGYIVNIEEMEKRNFVDPKYYYFPIPETQLLLNPNLKQTNFWD